MELPQIRSFEAVARLRSFTQAARELHIAQPAVSQHVRRLESELGVALLERTTRQVRVTDAGHAFNARAQAILAEIEEAKTELEDYAGVLKGRVRIASGMFIGEHVLPDLLVGFHAMYPGVELEVKEEIRNAQDVFEPLKNGEVDLAIYATEVMMPAGIEGEPLLEEDIVIAVSKKHELAGRSRITLRALRDEPWVMRPEHTNIRRIIDEAASRGANGYRPRVVMECSQMITLRAMVEAGMGVTALPSTAADFFNEKVSLLELGPPKLKRTVMLVWRQGRRRAAATDALLTYMRRHHVKQGKKRSKSSSKNGAKSED